MTILFVVILIIIGGLAVHLASQAAQRQMAAELRQEFHTRMQALEAKLEGWKPVTAAVVPAPPQPAAPPVSAPAPPVPAAKPVLPETIAIIAAAVTAALGKKVRIRSARMLFPQPDFVTSPWATQGRVFVQASHNLHLHGR
jgi:hypothetical protein